MNLVVDVGNTRLKAGIFEKQILLKTFQYPLDAARPFAMPEDIASLLIPFTSNDILISSVSVDPKELIPAFTPFGRTRIFTAATPIPITNAYRTPNSLGSDRLAAVVGANQLFPHTDCLVINAGTALTFDFVDASAVFRGGAISPGLHMRARALHTFTNKLPLVNLNNIDETNARAITGDDTESCLRAGILSGTIFEASKMIEQYDRLHPGITVVITGGDLKFFGTHLKNVIFANQIIEQPDLVLIGLNKIIETPHA